MIRLYRQQFFTLIITCLLATTTFAQDDKTQTWYGVLDAGPVKLRLQMELVENSDGEFSGKMISLDQGNAEVKCDSVTLTEKKLEFTIKQAGAKYSGKLNDAKDEADGTFNQFGNALPLKLAKVDKVPVQTHIETWTGKMMAGPQEFDFQFRIFADEKNKRTAKLDSFTEKITDIPCMVERDGNQITIEVMIAAAPAEFVGTLNDAVDTLTGQWTQGGNSFDLELKKVSLGATRDLTRKRPQTPKPPFGYDSEEVKIENKKSNLTLAGTLTTPKGTGPFPVVVTITGSGPQDRDETIFGHKLFFVIADHLAKNGFAVLRYDDRGTGQSTGTFAKSTSEDFAIDTEAVVDFLKTQKKIDSSKIILCGHSEGGIIAPMVASRRDDIAGVIMMAGPGVTGRRISVNQSKLMAEASGLPEYMIELNQTLLNGLYGRQEDGGEFTEDFIKELAEKMKLDIPADMRDDYDASSLINATIQTVNSEWFAFFAAYDPAPALTKLKCPVLAMVGEKDTQVDPKLNQPVIEASLKSGGNPDFEMVTLPDLNHLFQTCQTGALAEYNRIEETIAPAALDVITNWLIKRFK